MSHTATITITCTDKAGGVAHTTAGDAMNGLRRDAVLFGIGGYGYGLIELLWRGHTHWSMAIAGGLSLVMMAHVESRYRTHSLLYKAVLCAAGVTGIEFVFGLVFNRWLKMRVWDYSDMPMNIMGQICLLYTVLWGVLCCAVIPLVRRINRCFFR